MTAPEARVCKLKPDERARRMIVRLANRDDVGLIQSAARLERNVTLNADAALRLAEDERNRIVIAVEGEHLVGYLVAYLLDRLDGRSMALIYDLFVDESHRGHGLGSQLLSTLLRDARSAGVCKTWVFTATDNLPARRLYESQGGAPDTQRLYWFAGAQERDAASAAR